MLPDRVSNPEPLTYESGALPIALRGPANKTCMNAILKALSTVMNENRKNKVFTVIKQLKSESTVKTLNSQ